jgi:ribosomal subunit interface protein
MKTEVALLHSNYPSDLRQHIQERLDPLARFNERMTGVRAVFDLQHNEHTCELVASIVGASPLVVEARADRPQVALKHALDTLTARLKRSREKFLASKHH